MNDIDRLTSLESDLEALAAEIPTSVYELTDHQVLTVVVKKIDEIIDILRRLKVDPTS